MLETREASMAKLGKMLRESFNLLLSLIFTFILAYVILLFPLPLIQFSTSTSRKTHPYSHWTTEYEWKSDYSTLQVKLQNKCNNETRKPLHRKINHFN
jgi:hypothetical protein